MTDKRVDELMQSPYLATKSEIRWMLVEIGDYRGAAAKRDIQIRDCHDKIARQDRIMTNLQLSLARLQNPTTKYPPDLQVDPCYCCRENGCNGMCQCKPLAGRHPAQTILPGSDQ